MNALVVRLGSLGDIVHTVPAVAAVPGIVRLAGGDAGWLAGLRGGAPRVLLVHH